jgi:MSHA pilin protein MshD
MREIREHRRERGVTLVELVISIVVIAIAASAVLGMLASNVGRSADAMVMTQAVSIAEAYLEEITLKPFDDPDGSDGEPSRVNFDDVDDYNGLVDVGARDQFGNPIAALSLYTVAVTVAPSAALSGVPSTQAERVDVRVSYAPNVAVILSGYKTRL